MSGKTADIWWIFTRQTVTVARDQPVLNAIKLMVRRGFRHLPVTDAEWKLVGMLSAQDVMHMIHSTIVSTKKDADKGTALLKALSKRVEGIMSKDPAYGEHTQSLLDSITMMTEKGLSALPLIDPERKVQGIVTLRDLVFLMGQGAGRLGIKVHEIMTAKPFFLSPSDTILDAITIMATKKVRRVPISSDSGKSYVGMVTNKDTMRLLDSAYSYRVMRPEEAFRLKLSQVMDTGFGTIGANEDIRTAAWNMMTLGFGGLIAMNDFPGLITERDLILRTHKLKGPEFLRMAIRPQDDTSDRPSW